jgi:isopropylmalate/homocitrate/citramalate synthase
VEYVKDHGLTIFIHGEDSTRADWAFEREYINATAEAGAEIYRIADTARAIDHVSFM